MLGWCVSGKNVGIRVRVYNNNNYYYYYYYYYLAGYAASYVELFGVWYTFLDTHPKTLPKTFDYDLSVIRMTLNGTT